MVEVFSWHFPWLYVDGEATSIVVRPGRFAAHPVALWNVTGNGHFTTVVVEPGAPWPVEVRLDGDLGVLRVVPGELLGEEDGVRPDVLDRWRARRDRVAALSAPSADVA